jgi:aspartyl-tRNA(Asn)/glutamyl-tRNA(Gln) amidotransferase subunit C
MSGISREEVRRVVALARLSLSPQETERLTRELGAILGYVETLSRVDTADVPPTSHVMGLATPLRDDEPAEPIAPELAVANAPLASGSAFVVPKVIEGEEEG